MEPIRFLMIKVTASFGIFILLLASCGGPKEGQPQKINLRQLEVIEQSSVSIDGSLEGQDAVPSQDNIAGQGGNSSQNNNPNSQNNGGLNSDGTSSNSGLPGSNSSTPPSPASLTDSVKSYERTVYPLVRKNCAQGCHDSIVAPVFASENPVLAHDTILSSHKVDFVDVAKSRIILRMLPDQHRCPVEGCEAAAKEFQTAIDAWAKEVGDSVKTVPGGQQNLTTGVLTLVNPESKRMDSGLPPGVLLFEAEAGVLKAPMVALAVAGTNGGMVVHTAAGAGNQNNLGTAETQATLGGVTFDFDVLEAGTYQLIGKINAPANGNSSFYIKMDANPLVLWDFPTSGANYVFDVADAAAAVGTPHVFNLTPGKHKVEIRQRQEQTKVDSIILTSDPSIDPNNVKLAPKEVKTIAFDISEMAGTPGTKLTIEVIDYSPNAYLFKNPKISVASGSILVKGLKLLVNGKYLPQNATYTTVDMTVTAPGALLSTAALIAVKDKGPDLDQFSFSFEKLEKKP